MKLITRTVFTLLMALAFAGCAAIKPTPKPPAVVVPDSPPMPPPFDRATASKQPRAAKSVAPKPNPYTAHLSFVGHIGITYFLGKTNNVLFVAKATDFVRAQKLKELKAAPAPQRFAIPNGTALLLPSGPFQTASYGEWEPGVNYVLVDSTNMVIGKTYYQQATQDLLVWANTGNSVMWSDDDPNAFWGTIRFVPEYDPYYEFYRIMTP